MDWLEFRQTLKQDDPPQDLSALLQALWWDARGDWERAHRIAQDEAGPDAAWVHAYLHRKEGDLANAGYWYRRAGRHPSREPLEAEWEILAQELLERD